MSTQLTTNESPQIFEFQSETIGPPLPAAIILFTMPESTQARVVSYNSLVTSPINGVLFQTISLHEPGGGVVFAVGLAPLLNLSFTLFGAGVSRGIAGPEQARVPFFQPNVLLGSIPKDLYALPGYYFQLNNIAGVAQREAIITIFLATGND